ncbi:cytochrome P450 71B25 [Decorospora gaudefroyi]|uniref:Cytochrome P450 71B25 n=1 Tax=Decorospora gaudefroyi TaxID=184978 RepID=A0A6A5KSL1_9PLEO|nr:cytochrome P450 71B25 [Decorospora gaudefroyi]
MASLTLNRVAWQMALSAAVATLGVFVFKMIKVRSVFAKLKKQGLPMPPWDYAAGHLMVLPGLLEKFPKGSQQSDAFTLLSYDYKHTDGCFYIDCWPFSSPLLIVTSPEVAMQACSQEHDLPKPAILIPFFAPLAGGPNLFDMNGTEWKRSRALFNPGFSNNVMQECIPHIIEEADVYVALLREHARKGDTFSLDVLTCDYMMDVIGVISINARLHSMTTHNPLAAAMRSSIQWHCQDEELNPFVRWNPMRPLVEWYNGRTMDRYVFAELDKRYEDWKNNEPATRAKSVMDIAIAAYMGERKASPKLDAEFKKWASAQIRLFLFAGHDSTAATIVYSLHMLSKHPEALEKIRAEHDDVFGGDVDSAAQVLKEHPEYINKLPYTTAVIKETLRLFAPASGMRGGKPGVFLRDKNGNKFPTEGIYIWIVHGAIQRNPEYWPEPHSFLPERWLVEPGHPLYPPKGGWRPFEYGPRNCLGQTLAMLDIKLTLAMIVREFDVQDQYAEWDRLHPSSGVKTVFGERAYQVAQGAAHPVHGFPCKVFSRKKSS